MSVIHDSLFVIRHRPEGALRVAHFILCHEIGGAETYALSVAREQIRQGLDAVMIANSGSPLIAAAAGEGLAVARLDEGGRISLLKLGRRLADLIASYRLDILHSHYHHPHPVWLGRGCRRAGIPLIVSFHRPVARTARPDRKPPRRGVGLRRRAEYALADRYVPVSYASRDQHIAEGLDPARMVVVHNGVDPAPYQGLDRAAARKELGLPEDAFCFGTVGRLLRFKGLELFIEAAQVCGGAGFQPACAKFLVVGDGPQQTALEELAAKLGLGEACRFLGFRSDVPLCMAAMDCLVQPSSKEGLPMVLLEAMASSLPVIATRVGGVPELVLDGETGWLVAERTPGAISQAMLHATADPELAHEMGRRGRERVEEHFTLEQTVRRLTQVYREAIEAH